MDMRRVILFSLPFFFLLSCHPNASRSGGECKEFRLDETEKMDSFASVATLDKTRIDDAVLFSDIAKILVLADGRFVILDSEGTINLFDNDGAPVPGLRKGRAANEYVSALDMAWNGKDLLVLEPDRVKFFDLDGLSLDKSFTLTSERAFDAIAPCGKSGYYLFSSFAERADENKKKKDDLLFAFNAKGQMVDSYVRREDCTFTLFNISQSKDNVYYLRPQNTANVFYRLDPSGPKEQYRLDFGSKGIPARYYFDGVHEDMRDYMLSDFYKLPMECHETDEYVYFRFAGERAAEYIAVFKVGTGKGIMWQNTNGADCRILASDKDSFFFLLPAGSAESMRGCGPLADMIYASYAAGDIDPEGQYLIRLSFSF